MLISYVEIINLISDINAFIEGSEKIIESTQSIYHGEKENISNKYGRMLSNLEKNYQINCADVRGRSQEILTKAKIILSRINKLDEQLSRIDKYYVKTKERKECVLSNQTSAKYTDTTDYFEAFTKLQEEFDSLFKKYSENILPIILNDLHYIFSNKRKKEYEELIILRNTVISFINEIEKELPSVTENHVISLKNDYQKKCDEILRQQQVEINQLERQYSIALDKVAEEIYVQLDLILPDSFVSCLNNLMYKYVSNICAVNTTTEIDNSIINMLFLDYELDFFTKSSIIAEVIKERCSSLLVNNSTIRLPIILSTENAPVFTIINEEGSNELSQNLSHSLMFGFLSSMPVGNVKFSIIDPENRGSSIYPFFDAKKRLPELFGEKIYINKEDISNLVRDLNDYIENILQNQLSNQYNNIFEYSEENGNLNVTINVVLIYDFPKNLDESILSDLRNILRNGSKCGIYVIILCNNNSTRNNSEEFVQNIQSIKDLSVIITQNKENFSVLGLPLKFCVMPDKSNFSKFFSKYMLIFEGRKNKGIVFPPLIKALIEEKDPAVIGQDITHIIEIIRDFEQSYSNVPDIRKTFPQIIILGNILYPADIFSDSIGYSQILDKFGVKEKNDKSKYVRLPLMFDLRNNLNLFLNVNDENNKNMLIFTQHVIWDFLSFLPITKINICIFDPEQRGNSITPFLEFRKRIPEIFDNKIYTSSDLMQEKLRKINAYIDEFIQDKLAKKYKNILEYNLNNPNRTEAVTLLIIYDFPSNTDGKSLDLLINILRNGNQCGIFTIICFNSNVTFSRYENIEERIEYLQKYCTILNYSDGNYNLSPYNLRLEIPETLSEVTVDSFINEYAEKNEILKREGLSFKDIISRELFSMSSSKSIQIPVGIGDEEAIINILIGEGSSHHGLIAGATGSGKSTLLHTLIMSSMLHYSPEQLNLYLMDFKSGTEFKIYESARLPHIKLLALDAMQEFGESILEELVKEMENRGSLFKEAEQTSLNGYLQKTGLSLPRILVIMDEFQILFNDSTNRKVAMKCAELTKRIVTEGRAFGIHLIMATQSTKIISDLTLSKGTIEQMRIRIGLKCGEDDARYLFSDKNDVKALEMMKGPIGTAVMNLDYIEQPNIGFRTAYCDASTQRFYLDLIAKTFKDKPYTLQTFEGNRTINLLDYFNIEHIQCSSEIPIKIYMGTLIKVADPFYIQIDRKRKHNMLICGANEKMSDMIFKNYIISALLNKNSTIYCIDGDNIIGDNTSSEFYNTLLEFDSRFNLATDRASIISFINEIYEKYLNLKKQINTNNECIFIMIKNLQFIDIIKSMLKGEIIDETEFISSEQVECVNIETEIPNDPFATVNSMFADSSNENNNNIEVGTKLVKMINDGSGFGIYFVITSLEYQTVRETMYYGENTLNKFPERIIFSLNDNDSDNMIENISTSSLRDNTVYFTDGIKNTFQLKPYITPSLPDLKKFIGSIHETK